MEKFTSFDKLSKKKQRELNALRRGTRGSFSPVTRKPENPKAYNRKKTQHWKKELPDAASFIFSQSLV